MSQGPFKVLQVYYQLNINHLVQQIHVRNLTKKKVNFDYFRHSCYKKVLYLNKYKVYDHRDSTTKHGICTKFCTMPHAVVSAVTSDGHPLTDSFHLG